MRQLTIFNSENAERETGFSYLCTSFNSLTITLTITDMKTTQATVNLVLNEQRKNKDGLCPVVLRIFWKGRKDRQTGIYIPKSQWLLKEQCVKPTHPQAGTLNMRLAEIKNAVIQRRNLLVAKGLDYTIDDLLSEKEVLSRSSSFSSVLEDMVKVKGLSQNTVMAYKASLKRLEKHYGSGFGLSALTSDTLKGFASSLKRQDVSDSTVNVTLACVKSVYSYGKSKGLVDGMIDWKYWRKYKISQKHRSLDKAMVDSLLSWFLRESVTADAIEGVWCYNDGVEDKLCNRNSKLCAIALCLIAYYCRGLAFCDLVRIKDENISVISVGDKDYYVISGLHRKKTNVVIPDIYIEVTDDVMPLFHYYYTTMGLRQGYLFPVLQNNRLEYHYDSDKKISEATGTCSTMVNKRLREVLDELGYDSAGISYYCFRHSFASHYMSDTDSNPVYLATMMGRSVSGIFRYVKSIESAEDLIRESSRAFNRRRKPK